MVTKWQWKGILRLRAKKSNLWEKEWNKRKKWKEKRRVGELIEEIDKNKGKMLKKKKRNMWDFILRLVILSVIFVPIGQWFHLYRTRLVLIMKLMIIFLSCCFFIVGIWQYVFQIYSQWFATIRKIEHHIDFIPRACIPK